MIKTTVICSSVSFLLGYCLGSYTTKPAKQEKQIEIRYKTVVQKEYIKAEQQQQQEKVIIKYRDNGTVAQKTEVVTVTQAKQDAVAQQTVASESITYQEAKVTTISRSYIFGASVAPHAFHEPLQYKVLAGYRLMPSLAVYATSTPTLSSFEVGAMVLL